MSYKTILLSLNEIDRNAEIMPAVARFAANHKAKVIGLYVLPGITVYPGTTFTATPDMFDVNRRFYEREKDATEKLFAKAMKAEGVSSQFHLVDSDSPTLAPEVIEHSRHVDLLIISATSAGEARGVEYDFVEGIVMASGRPVLVLPHSGKIDLSFPDILLAWNDSRESSRATFDALPLLQQAKAVHVTKVDHNKRNLLPGVDIAETLAAHKVKCDVLTINSDGRTEGEALLNTAHDYNTNLIVMGAYGHSRLMEFIFGGATRHVIKNIDRPVLMAH